MKSGRLRKNSDARHRSNDHTGVDSLGDFITVNRWMSCARLSRPSKGRDDDMKEEE